MESFVIVSQSSTTTNIPETIQKNPNFRKDLHHILLLFFLYILQGIPLGLILTISFLLQSQGVSYQQQAKFSLAHWPFSLKVIYAPIIDSVYWKRMGRRKSWLIPIQYLIAAFLFTLSLQIEGYFKTKDITNLTIMFFILNFLAASQDVAVDGWALTMLSPENVGYASSCNAAGLILGFVLGYSVFLGLDSVSFANKLRRIPGDTGLVTLSQFLLFWTIIFALTTTLVLIFKKEKKETNQGVLNGHMNILQSYKYLGAILRLRNIQWLALILLTVRIGTGATEGLTKLKLVEAEVPKEILAFFSIPMLPFKFLIPLMTAKWTAGSKPMNAYIQCLPFCYSFAIIYPLVVHSSTWFKSTASGEYDLLFYWLLFGVFVLELIPEYVRRIAGMSFAAQVSDPAIGGTYMTLINTLNNSGGTWPTSLVLWLVNYFGICWEKQSPSSSSPPSLHQTLNTTTHFSASLIDEQAFLNTTQQSTTTTKSIIIDEGSWEGCLSGINGYYVLSIFCVIFGYSWFIVWGRQAILNLQSKPRSS